MREPAPGEEPDLVVEPDPVMEPAPPLVQRVFATCEKTLDYATCVSALQCRILNPRIKSFFTLWCYLC